jgi:hypothetical protein
MFSGSATNFLSLITISLIDNKAVDKVQNINFTDRETGFLVTLGKTPESKGFYTDKPGGVDRHTVLDIRMDIAPVKLTLTPIK